MKTFLFLAALLVVTLAAEIKYTDKYDNIDLDQILHNDRLLANYFRCVMDKGPCSPDGAELKKNMPDALTNGCQKCTETQKKSSEKIIKFFMEKKQDMWKQIEEKYDPEGIYAKRFLQVLEKHDTNV